MARITNKNLDDLVAIINDKLGLEDEAHKRHVTWYETCGTNVIDLTDKHSGGSGRIFGGGTKKECYTFLLGVYRGIRAAQTREPSYLI